MTFEKLNKKLGGDENASDWAQHANGGGAQGKKAKSAQPPTTDTAASAALAPKYADRVTPDGHPEEIPDPDLARICEPHADAINDYLRREGRVRPNETWQDMPHAFADRVKKNPAGFLKIVSNGKAVAAGISRTF